MKRVTAETRPMTMDEFAKRMWPLPFFFMALWLMFAIPPLGALVSGMLIIEALRRREHEPNLPWRLLLVLSILTLLMSIIVFTAAGFWNLG